MRACQKTKQKKCVVYLFFLHLANRRTGPREGEIQIDCRRNGYHLRGVGWLLRIKREKPSTTLLYTPEKIFFSFINYIILPHIFLWCYTRDTQKKTGSLHPQNVFFFFWIISFSWLDLIFFFVLILMIHHPSYLCWLIQTYSSVRVEIFPSLLYFSLFWSFLLSKSWKQIPH